MGRESRGKEEESRAKSFIGRGTTILLPAYHQNHVKVKSHQHEINTRANLQVEGYSGHSRTCIVTRPRLSAHYKALGSSALVLGHWGAI